MSKYFHFCGSLRRKHCITLPDDLTVKSTKTSIPKLAKPRITICRRCENKLAKTESEYGGGEMTLRRCGEQLATQDLRVFSLN